MSGYLNLQDWRGRFARFCKEGTVLNHAEFMKEPEIVALMRAEKYTIDHPTKIDQTGQRKPDLSKFIIVKGD